MHDTAGVTTYELWITSEIREIERVHACVNQLLDANKCTVLDQLAVRMAIDEAMVNAITHGNQLEPHRLVHVLYWIDERHIGVRIEDEGRGFDPTSVATRSTNQWFDAPRGRGLLIMQRFMHEVAFDQGGCVVTMKRFLSD